MRKLLIIVCSLILHIAAKSQTLQTVTTSGNTSTNAIRFTGEANIGISGNPELVLGYFSTIKTSDTRNFIGWKADAATNATSNGPAGTLMLQSRSNISDVPIDFITGLGTPALRMRIAGNGNVAIGSTSLTPLSRLFIAGSGTTSATTSFQVQSSAGTDLVKLFDNGNLGVGTTVTAAEKIHIQNGNLLIAGTTALNTLQGMVKFSTTSYPNFYAGIGGMTNGGGLDQLDLLFYTCYGGASEKMRIMSNTGYVGIGTSTPAAKLDVNGTTYSRKLYVGTPDANTITNMGTNLLAVNGTAVFVKAKVAVYGSAWPDYVFSPGYKTTPLDSLEQFIQLNKHLPDVPSADEVQKDGIDLGNNQALLLKKIEELTLIVIEQNKRIEKLENDRSK